MPKWKSATTAPSASSDVSRPECHQAQAQTELSGFAEQLQSQYPETNKDVDAQILTFNQRFNGGPIRIVFLALLGAVGFVLLIACANVANLLLSRSANAQP